MEACVYLPSPAPGWALAHFPAASLHMQPEGLGRDGPLKPERFCPGLGVWSHL